MLPQKHHRLADILETIDDLEDVRVAETRAGGPAEGPEPFTATVTIAIEDVDDHDAADLTDFEDENSDTDFGSDLESAIELANEDPSEFAEAFGDEDESEESSPDNVTDDDPEPDPFTCDECGKSFDSKRGRSIHQARTHTEDDVEPLSAEDIKAVRERRDWTQADLAAELDVGNSTVANWETDVSRPSGESAKQLRRLYETLADDSDLEPEPESESEAESDDDGSDFVSETDGGAVANDVDDNSGRSRDDPPNLPDGTPVAEVEALVDEHQYLEDVANELEISVGQARSLLVHIGRYSDVREGGRR